MLKKYIIYFFLLIPILLIGCNTVNVINVEIDGKTVPTEEVHIDDFELSSIILIVTKSNGYTETVSVNSSMISTEDFLSLSTTGEKNILVEYHKFKMMLSVNLIDTEEITYTVVFKDINGNILKTETIEEGANATAPTPPEINGYVFIRWDKEYINVSTDLEINPIYEKEHTVTFKDLEGNILKTEIVVNGQAANAPLPPFSNIDGYTFIKWDVDFSNVTSDLVVTTVYEQISAFSTIQQVKDKIDQTEPNDVFVEFIGTVIGFDSMGFAHVADATGAIYVRAFNSNLINGNKVKISGYGYVFKGNSSFPEYTRQIKSDNISIEPYFGTVSEPKARQIITANDLYVDYTTDLKNTGFHGNVVQITGYVQTGSTRFLFYLLDDSNQKIANIHHYSNNFQNQITDSTKNVFLDLNGKKVTLTGIIYRYFTAEHIWTIQCIGFEDEVIVHDGHVAHNTVNIFTFNDTHGVLYTEGNTPGLEKVQTVIKTLENENGPYIKIANGDIFQGTYISNIHYGRPLIEALNIMKLDALVIGNHEFDWGIEEIAKYADGNPDNGEANFPFLAANIVYKDTGQKLSWTKDYVIVENNGYKVGIIGVIGYGLESSITHQHVKDFRFLDPVPIAGNLSEKLRNQYNCDMVIVATHAHSANDNYRYSSLSGSKRIDAIITGHTHQQIGEYIPRSDGYDVPVIQCFGYNHSVGEIIFYFDDLGNLLNGTIKHYNPSLYSDDIEILDLINSYSNDIAAGNRIVAYTTEYLTRQRLGREMVTAMKEKYKVDVTFINTGGVRSDLSVGNIAVKDVFKVFPFDNNIILTTMKGSDIRSLYNNHGSFLYFNPGFNVNNINSNQTYTVATICYVFYGTHYTTQFANSTPQNTNVLMRDVFIEYLESDFS